MANYPLVDIYWLDSSISDFWESVESPTKPVKLHTVGYLIAENDDCLEVVSTLNEAGCGRHRTCIIRANIISIYICARRTLKSSKG